MTDMKRWTASPNGYLPLGLDGPSTPRPSSNKPALLRIVGLPALCLALILSALSLLAFRNRHDLADHVADRLCRDRGQEEVVDAVVGYTAPAALDPVLEHDSRTWIAPTPELPLDATIEERILAWDSTPVSLTAYCFLMTN